MVLPTVLLCGHAPDADRICRDGTRYRYFLKFQGDPSIQPRLSILVYFVSYKVYLIHSHYSYEYLKALCCTAYKWSEEVF